MNVKTSEMCRKIVVSFWAISLYRFDAQRQNVAPRSWSVEDGAQLLVALRRDVLTCCVPARLTLFRVLRS
jgi:hypothetical protein